MLQQTQVSTVMAYFERFLKRFPTVQDLAAASQEAVLGLWSGLGYYSRARNLHRCAQAVVQAHGGAFPRQFEMLQTLPGIGPSTAAAIASLCFEERVAILDGNVKRVLSRVLGWDQDLSVKTHERPLWEAAQAVLPARAGARLPIVSAEARSYLLADGREPGAPSLRAAVIGDPLGEVRVWVVTPDPRRPTLRIQFAPLGTWAVPAATRRPTSPCTAATSTTDASRLTAPTSRLRPIRSRRQHPRRERPLHRRELVYQRGPELDLARRRRLRTARRRNERRNERQNRRRDGLM